MRCEGEVLGPSTILYPMPKPIRHIMFLKKEGEELKPVYKIEFPGETWIYDSIVYVEQLDFDALLVETSEDKRIVLKDELNLPTRSKLVEAEKKVKRRKRRRKTRKKTRKTKEKKTSKKKKRRKRRKSKRKSKKKRSKK